jgi:biofilm protein TabA
MIVADLENLAAQASPAANLRRGLEWLKENCARADLPERIDIQGKDLYVLVQAYETQPAGAEVRLEAHRNYIDIQYVVSGEEMMGWGPVRALRDATPYNPEKDVFHGLLPAAEMTSIQVRAGQAAIFYPEDAHAPKLAVAQPVAVRKIVVKVRV